MTTHRPYNDPEYRRAKAWLRANPQPCWHQHCERMATTLDHDPPIAHHDHVRGSGCCKLRPACLVCQSRQGAAIVNARRASGYSW